MKTIAFAALSAIAAAQEQIHLALTGVDSQMHISYAYPSGCPWTDSIVSYGPTTALGSQVTASTQTDPLSGDCWLDATMTGLKANTKYYYSIDSSSLYSFTNQPVREGGKIYAVLADFGMANDVSIGQLAAEAASNQFDAVIHAGDYAYDLEDDSGETGNEFMNAIQPVAANMPYMGSPGNHESDEDTFAQYLGRFNGFAPAAANSGSNSTLWYSFNDGLVHWISIDTELWYYGGTQEQISAQYEWLQNDLAGVDRSVTPWVIAYGHKQGWMDKVEFTQLESIMQAGGVDLYFCGHQHNYQRGYAANAGTNYPSCSNAAGTVYYNCPAMISVVVGSPGCKEGLSSIVNTNSAMLVTNTNEYGYGHLQVVNSTHLFWGWEAIGQRDLKTGAFKPVDTSFTDQAWIISENQGSRDIFNLH